MTADEVAKDIVDTALKVPCALGPGCWNRPIKLVWHMISKDVATGSNASSFLGVSFLREQSKSHQLSPTNASAKSLPASGRKGTEESPCHNLLKWPVL
jgi:hypothetical protein